MNDESVCFFLSINSNIVANHIQRNTRMDCGWPYEVTPEEIISKVPLGEWRRAKLAAHRNSDNVILITLQGVSMGVAIDTLFIMICFYYSLINLFIYKKLFDLSITHSIL